MKSLSLYLNNKNTNLCHELETQYLNLSIESSCKAETRWHWLDGIISGRGMPLQQLKEAVRDRIE